jgi:hypothetical protein
VFLVLTSRYFSPKLLICCIFCWLCLPVSKIICFPLGGITEICENFLRATMMCFKSSGSSTTPTSHLSQVTAGSSSSGPYQQLIFFTEKLSHCLRNNLAVVPPVVPYLVHSSYLRTSLTTILDTLQTIIMFSNKQCHPNKFVGLLCYKCNRTDFGASA